MTASELQLWSVRVSLTGDNDRFYIITVCQPLCLASRNGCIVARKLPMQEFGLQTLLKSNVLAQLVVEMSPLGDVLRQSEGGVLTSRDLSAIVIT